MSTYIYSSSPQIRSKRTTRQVMAEVCIALVPACIAGCILLGWGALLQLAIASISAVLAEFVYLLCCKKSFKEILHQFDFSSLVTGMLVGMNMYANSKWYVPMLASIFAIVVVKMLFGGTGKNIVNPAITGRIFAFISFGAAFGGTMYFVNESGNASKVLSPITGGYIQGATPLQALFGAQTGGNTLTNLDLFLGTGVPGCIGETCKLALIIGGIYLVVRGILNFRWPLVYILTTGVVAVLLVWYDKCAAFAEANGSVNSVMVGEYFTQAWNYPQHQTGQLHLLRFVGNCYGCVAPCRKGRSGVLCNFADEPACSPHRQVYSSQALWLCKTSKSKKGGEVKWLKKQIS